MLEVAYERNVRLIAAEFAERPRGSLYLAVGKSAEVRAAVEAAFEERGIAVARVSLTADEGPWARIAAGLEQSGRATEEVLLSVAGLGELAEGDKDRILGHLNLGREIRVTKQLHVLLWVGGLDDLERSRMMASDLWGHRSGVAIFLSNVDFQVATAALGPDEESLSLEAELRDAEMRLSTELKPSARIQLLAEKALLLQVLGRLNAALDVLGEAEKLLPTLELSPRELSRAEARILVRKLEILVDADCTEEADRLATEASVGPEADPLKLYFAAALLARLRMRSGRVVEGCAHLATALEVVAESPLLIAGGRCPDLLARADVFVRLGALEPAMGDVRAAQSEAERVRDRTHKDTVRRPMLLADMESVLARVGLSRGDVRSSLAHAHRRLTRVADSGALYEVSEVFASVARCYDQLGLLEDARRFARRAVELLSHSPGEAANPTRWLGALAQDELQLEQAVGQFEAAISMYEAAAAADASRPHRRAGWLRAAAAVLYSDLRPVVGSEVSLRRASEMLTRAALAAEEANSPEQLALTQRSRAELACAAKQWERAESEFLGFFDWASAHYGPYKRAEILLDLAAVAREPGDLPRALDYASRAQREVALDPPELLNRFTAIAAAREIARICKAMNDLPAAHAALGSAITVAQGEGLRLREREILLDLAELPPAPDASDRRIQHAQRARAIAQDAAFPVDEAEAMLVLAELHLEAGNAKRARALFDQSVWIVDRIGPPQVRQRAARVRGKLEA